MSVDNVKTGKEEIDGLTIPAVATSGTMPLGAGVSVGDIWGDVFSPRTVLLKQVESFAESMLDVWEEKQYFVPVLALALIWLILMALSLLGVQFFLVDLFSFLFFAQGGLHGGILGVIGGSIAKGIMAYFIFMLVIFFMEGENYIIPADTDFRSIITQFRIKNKTDLILMMFGWGFALVLYNFFNPTLSLQNSMIGIVMAIILLGAGLNKRFLSQFFTAVIFRLTKKVDFMMAAKLILAGSFGFLGAIFIAAFPLADICYWLGSFLLIMAGIITILFGGERKKKT